MLLGSMGLLSLVVAALCLMLGGVGILAALGIFVGSFLGLLLLAFLFLWAVTAGVDQNVPQEKDSKFFRWVVKLYVPAIWTILRMKVEVRGKELLPKEGRMLLVCNHLSILDPVTLLGCLPECQLAFVSKKENADMFIVGNLMHRLMCQLVNRENDREALKTILKCIQMLKEDLVSVGVFPEGHCSEDGRLQHFRPGVFKIATKAQVPIVVCSLQNTNRVFHNILRLKSTNVPLHIVGVIPPEDFAGRTAVDISQWAYDRMLADLGPAFAPLDAE